MFVCTCPLPTFQSVQPLYDEESPPTPTRTPCTTHLEVLFQKPEPCMRAITVHKPPLSTICGLMLARAHAGCALVPPAPGFDCSCSLQRVSGGHMLQGIRGGLPTTIYRGLWEFEGPSSQLIPSKTPTSQTSLPPTDSQQNSYVPDSPVPVLLQVCSFSFQPLGPAWSCGDNICSIGGDTSLVGRGMRLQCPQDPFAYYAYCTLFAVLHEGESTQCHAPGSANAMHLVEGRDSGFSAEILFSTHEVGTLVVRCQHPHTTHTTHTHKTVIHLMLTQGRDAYRLKLCLDCERDALFPMPHTSHHAG